MQVCVIGAGVAGLTAAGIAQSAGCDVQVLEREAVVGGRARSCDVGGNTFDLGAQFIEADDAIFSQELRAWVKAGIAAPWKPKANIVSRGRLTAPKNANYHVGVGGQGRLCEALAAGLNVRTDIEVQRVRYVDEGWSITCRDLGLDACKLEEIGFDFVVLAVPPEVACSMLLEVPSISRTLSQVRSEQAWVLCLTFARPLRLPFEMAVSRDNAVLTGFMNQSRKPGRKRGNESWWLQSKPAWAARHSDAGEVEKAMLRAFKDEVFPIDRFHDGEIVAVHLHQWADAWVPKGFASSSLSDNARDGAIVDEQLKIALCGDWVHIASGRGGSIQGAYLSGVAAAKKLLQSSQEHVQ